MSDWNRQIIEELRNEKPRLGNPLRIFETRCSSGTGSAPIIDGGLGSGRFGQNDGTGRVGDNDRLACDLAYT